MKQVLQNLKTGKLELAEVPCPEVKTEHLLIQTKNSLISSGTERMLLKFGRGGWIEKVRQQPEKVRMLLEKIKTDGFFAALKAVESKMELPIAMGYSNVGTVLETGPGISRFSSGDRIVSNGSHAEVVSVAQRFCAKIPENVTDESAAFTVIGAIALQGIRLANPQKGETFVVLGLGLVGLMSVQILKSYGCRVIGMDYVAERVRLAEKFGAETFHLSHSSDPVSFVLNHSNHEGVDGVFLAVSTKSHDPVKWATAMSRRRARIVLIGVAGLNLSRDHFYKKELSFQVSSSYGPDRYQPAYTKSLDRYAEETWTVRDNFETVLKLFAEKKIDVSSLITHRFDIAQTREAYELLGGKEPSLGILFGYEAGSDTAIQGASKSSGRATESLKVNEKKKVTAGFIGAGNYARSMLIPAIRNNDALLKTIVSMEGLSAHHAARKYGFKTASSKADDIFNDSDIDAVFIATRHDSHAELTVKALKAGKHVFVEKPLALNLTQLSQIKDAYEEALKTKDTTLMVGFNRRFSPLIRKVKGLLKPIKTPKNMVMTVNAGRVDADHWTQNAHIGGGRIIGEACHFIDLLRFIADAEITDTHISRLGARDQKRQAPDDNVTITLKFKDGSHGVIHYFSNGHKSFEKERLEIFCGGKILQLHNFKRLKGYGWPGFRSMKLWRQDKGQADCIRSFLSSVQNGKPLIGFDQLFEVARVSFEAADSNQK